METAVAYIRVSSQRQVDEGGSLESQLKLVERHATNCTYRLVQVFREEGESAKTDQRPELQALLKFCRERKNGVSVVVVPKIDRLARNVTDYTNFKMQLLRLGIRLDSIGERIEDTPVGRFTETILASVAQFDNEIRAERSKGGMIDAVSQGRWVWRAPIGYRSIRVGGKGTVEPDPIIGPLLEGAFRQLATGRYSPVMVRTWLSDNGVPLTHTTFYRVLCNELYMGRIHAFGKVFAAEPPFVPLVDEVTFHKARYALKHRDLPRKYSLESTAFPLRRAIFCDCGGAYTAASSRGSKGKKYPYYFCSKCRGRNYSRSTVHAHFSMFLGGFKGAPKAWDGLRQQLVELEASHVAGIQRGNRGNLAHIEKLQALRDAIAMKNAMGVLSDEVTRRQVDRLTAQIAEAAISVPESPVNTSAEELLEYARRFFGNLKRAWEPLSLETKKNLLRFLFPQGVLYVPDAGFRTRGNPLSERLKQIISSSKFHLVDLEDQELNDVHIWLQQLYSLMSENGQSSSK